MTTTPHDKQWELIAEKSPALVEARQQLVAALAACKLKDEALSDMRSGWRYIRETYGDLYGVGWERAENKADAALAIQPDDSALREWLGEPVAWMFDGLTGTYFGKEDKLPRPEAIQLFRRNKS